MPNRPDIYLHPEAEDWNFIRSTATSGIYDGAIIPSHYLASYPSKHKNASVPPERLLDELGDVPSIIDPSVRDLGHDRASLDELSDRRAATPLVRAVSPPVPLDRLLDQGWLNHLTDVALDGQLRSPVVTAVSFEFRSEDDPALEATIDLIRRASEMAGARDVAAVIQVTKGRSQLAESVAERVTDAGARRILLRLRGLKPEHAAARDVERYCTLIETYRRLGAYVIADCVGRLGPILTLAQVDGFSTGARYFRTVPQSLMSSGGGGGIPLKYEVPGQLRSVERAQMSNPSLPPCPVEGCTAVRDGDGSSLRMHLLHELANRASAATENPSAFLQQLRQLGDVTNGWADGVDNYRRAHRAA